MLSKYHRIYNLTMQNHYSKTDKNVRLLEVKRWPYIPVIAKITH